jgi:hypothetical protein
MASVKLRIEPELCGAMSIGTGRVVKLLAQHLELGLEVALNYVDRCVFSAEEVDIPAPSAAAARFISAVSRLPPVPNVVARAGSA